MNTRPDDHEFLQRFHAAKAWWSDILGGSDWPEKAQEQWPFRALAYLRLGFHDFFEGSGPMEVCEYLQDGSMKDFQVVVEPSTNPLACVLREAVEASRLLGLIQLRMEETRWPDMRSYRRLAVAVLDWDLLPSLCQAAWQEALVGQPYFGPDKRGLLSGLVDASRSEDPLEGFIHAVLYDEGHPLTPHLLKAMSKPEGPVPLWRAWCRHKGTGGRDNVVLYREIPQFPARYIACSEDDILAILDKGVVLDWPENGMRVRVRLARHFQQAHDLSWANGERLLHIEPTTDPLTELTDKEGGLQVFGRGYSQQTDRVPVVNEKKTVCLFYWGQYDFSTTIMVTLGEDGLPEVAWVDGSCT